MVIEGNTKIGQRMKYGNMGLLWFGDSMGGRTEPAVSGLINVLPACLNVTHKGFGTPAENTGGMYRVWSATGSATDTHVSANAAFWQGNDALVALAAPSGLTGVCPWIGNEVKYTGVAYGDQVDVQDNYVHINQVAASGTYGYDPLDNGDTIWRTACPYRTQSMTCKAIWAAHSNGIPTFNFRGVFRTGGVGNAAAGAAQTGLSANNATATIRSASVSMGSYSGTTISPRGLFYHTSTDGIPANKYLDMFGYLFKWGTTGFHLMDGSVPGNRLRYLYDTSFTTQANAQLLLTAMEIDTIMLNIGYNDMNSESGGNIITTQTQMETRIQAVMDFWGQDSSGNYMDFILMPQWDNNTSTANNAIVNAAYRAVAARNGAHSVLWSLYEATPPNRIVTSANAWRVKTAGPVTNGFSADGVHPEPWTNWQFGMVVNMFMEASAGMSSGGRASRLSIGI